MSLKNKIVSTPSTITLYGERFKQLEAICYEHQISTTAFYNTLIGAFVEGSLTIEGGELTRRRVSGNSASDVLEQLRFTIRDKAGNKVY